MENLADDIKDQLIAAGATDMTPTVYMVGANNPLQAQALVDIVAERKYQDSIWGEAFERENMTEEEWAKCIVEYACNIGQCHVRNPNRTFDERMMKVAALAVAAREWKARVSG